MTTSSLKAIVVTNKALTSLSHGYDLRVWHLSRSLAERGYRLGLVSLPYGADSPNELPPACIQVSELFDCVLSMGEEHLSRTSRLRHLRLSEADYWTLALPRLEQEVLYAIKDSASRLDADRVIFFGPNLAGIASRLKEHRVLLDVCDSTVLAVERAIQVSGAAGSGLMKRLQLARWKRAEGRLPWDVSLVTTINPADSMRVRELSGGAVNVVTVPNGIAPQLESFEPCLRRRRRGVIFWGNLDFEPNRLALNYFFEKVVDVYLAATDIEICIVGKNPDQWLRDRARADSRIRLAGFVPDLYSLASEYPVMVNPMGSGSGMKNKVLEAFALGCAVVSTALGIESFEGVSPGTHFLQADNAAEFAGHIQWLLDHPDEQLALAGAARELVLERYTWSSIGERWAKLVASL